MASLLPGSHVSEVVRDGAVVGVAWLGHEGDTTDVYDAWLDDPADGPALREVVLDRARSWSSVQLRAGVVAGNAGQRAMVDGGGFTLMATNLRLDLDGPPPEPGDVRVEPMSESRVRHVLRPALQRVRGRAGAGGRVPGPGRPHRAEAAG